MLGACCVFGHILEGVGIAVPRGSTGQGSGAPLALKVSYIKFNFF